jgi:hypothetical protein
LAGLPKIASDLVRKVLPARSVPSDIARFQAAAY